MSRVCTGCGVEHRPECPSSTESIERERTSLRAELEEAKELSHKIICSYCGRIDEKEESFDKTKNKMAQHVLSCEKNPTVILAKENDELRAAKEQAEADFRIERDKANAFAKELMQVKHERDQAQAKCAEMAAHQSKLVEACEFAAGAIEDAIGLEDGLDGGAGEAVLEILDKAVSPLDTRRLDAERNSFGYDYADVGAELAVRWKFPYAFSDAVRAFPKPLEHQPFEPMAAIIHLAAWLARTNENNLTLDEARATCPTEVAVKLGLDPYIMLDKMPPLTELSNGLEELVA